MTRKKANKVLPGEIFILISFNVKAPAKANVNSQHMWMNLTRFLSLLVQTV